MRSRALPALGLSAIALALAATTLTGTATAASGPSATAGGGAAVTIPATTDAVCKGAKNTTAPNGDGVTAQEFGPTYDAYDTWGAADFKTRKCKPNSVDIYGVVPGGGSANGATVSIHKDASGVPGALKCTGSVTGPGPDFNVPISGCGKLKGKFWLVGQVDQDFATQGQWFWATTDNQLLTDDLWQNPGNGFGTGCTTWGTLASCIGLDYEYMFRVNKP